MSTLDARKVGRPKDPDLEARRRTEILDEATLAFADLGFANTQVQTIANRLGVGNGTIYRYFPTKEALLIAAVERGLNDLTEVLDRVLDADEEPLQVFRQAIHAYLKFFHERPALAELFIQERAAFRHHHRPLYFTTKDQHTKQKHETFFQKLLSQGAIRPMPSEQFLGVIGDLLYGTILTNLLSGRSVDPRVQAESVLDVICHGVLADPKPRKGKK